jgi:hypothetical protein
MWLHAGRCHQMLCSGHTHCRPAQGVALRLARTVGAWLSRLTCQCCGAGLGDLDAALVAGAHAEAAMALLTACRALAGLRGNQPARLPCYLTALLLDCLRPPGCLATLTARLPGCQTALCRSAWLPGCAAAPSLRTFHRLDRQALVLSTLVCCLAAGPPLILLFSV